MAEQILPKISIVTPSYNQGEYLERTIHSVLDQNYPRLEYIIIDGGSTDNSIEIIKKYERHLAYWISEPDTGQSNAINKGVARSTGILLSWLNSDDCLCPGALQSIAELFLHNPNAGAFVGAGDFVDRRDKVLHRKEPIAISLEVLFDWLNEYYIMQPSCFIARAAWDAVGGLDESIHFAMDVDLWLKIVRKYTFMNTNTVISRSLVHASAKTSAYRYFCEVDTALVILKHGGDRQARMYLDALAAKLAWYDKTFHCITANPLFRILLPLVKRSIGYNRQISAVYPSWIKK